MSIQPDKLVIIGNGMATGRLLDEMLKRDHKRYSITVIGDEPHGSYNRIMLSPVLAGELKKHSIIQKDQRWFGENNISLMSGKRASHIDSARHLVHVDDQHLHYDHLVIATGSRPSTIPAKNQTLKNIFSFRTLDDVNKITLSTENNQTAIVVGGGLLGLEAAYGLAQQGIDVTLIHRSKWLLNRQLDEKAGTLLKEVMEQKNIRFELATEVLSFTGQDTVTGAILKNGKTLSCDFAVIATGITPNIELGTHSGLETGLGICVDDYMNTSAPDISALGECCEHRGSTFGLVEPIWQQCISLADKLCSKTNTPFVNHPVATKLKVSGVQLLSAGEHITQATHREIVLSDETHKTYRKILLKNNKIVGAVLFGDTRSGQDYFEVMQQKIDISEMVPELIFGKVFFNFEQLSPR